VIVGKDILNLVSVYTPQSDRTREEKEDFFTSLGQALSSINTGER